jgi:hypothetical protein
MFCERSGAVIIIKGARISKTMITKEQKGIQEHL